MVDIQPIVPVVGRETTTTDWQRHAQCAHHSLDKGLFDAVSGLRALEALEMCRRCPVVESCRQWAIEERYFEGVAGGAVWPRSPGRKRRHSLTEQDIKDDIAQKIVKEAHA